MGPRRFYRLTSGPTSNAVDYVELPEGAADIGDFRKALFDDVRGSLPSGLHVSALKVSTEAHGRLALETPFAGYGESEDDPFFVEVPKVWFQLVDAVTHAAFMGTTAQSVPLDEQCTVENLQNAVFHKVSRAFPKQTTAAKLWVYEDFSAYEAKQPLEVLATLDNRGKEPSNPLCVLVPPTVWSSQNAQIVVGDVASFVTDSVHVNLPNLVSFWKAFGKDSTAMEGGSVVVLPEGTYLLGNRILGSKIFIRGCFSRLLVACLKTNQDEAKFSPHLVIIGDSGVGKTFFGFVVLLYLARIRATVVYECGGSRRRRFLFSSDLVAQGSGQDFVGILRRPTTYYIVDGARPNYFPCKTILLTSPTRSVWFEFSKVNCGFVYMPVWPKEEMLEYHNSIYFDKVSPEMVEYCYRLWGGIVRYVAEFVVPDAGQSQLDSTIRRANMGTLVDACAMLKADDSHDLHGLLHYRVDEHFRKDSFAFASEYVQDEVYKHLYKQNKDKLIDFLAMSDGVDEVAVLRGYLFGGYAHSLLRKGGTFRVRRLVDPAEYGAALERIDYYTAEVELPRRKTVFFKNDAELVAADADSYLRPSTNNMYGSVDAIGKPDVFFRVSSLEHSCMQDGLIHALTVLGNPESPRLYIALPPDRFEECQYQQCSKSSNNPELNKMQQFALEVMLPSLLN